jgi:Cysteine-rich CPXCG
MGGRRHDRIDALTRELTRLDDQAIDTLYGLEPVFEPGGALASPGLIEFVSVECPYCWQNYGTQVDLSGGSFTHVEDCQVCCQPIELECEVDATGALVAVRLRRMD